jgi:hypothetical protein
MIRKDTSFFLNGNDGKPIFRGRFYVLLMNGNLHFARTGVRVYSFFADFTNLWEIDRKTVGTKSPCLTFSIAMVTFYSIK